MTTDIRPREKKKCCVALIIIPLSKSKIEKNLTVRKVPNFGQVRFLFEKMHPDFEFIDALKR